MRKICKILLFVFCILLFSANADMTLKADGQIIIEDEEDLLSDAEEKEIGRAHV